MAETKQKVITLDNLDAVIRKVKGDFATKVELEEALANFGGGFEFATEDEVLGLFTEAAAE